jgi:alpha-ketoglutaric semialdehyde dehydrogenase
MATYRNFVNGEWVESRSGERQPVVNPANRDEVLGEVPFSTPEEVRDAVEAASRAYPAWRFRPAAQRAELLRRFARTLADRADEVARALTREEGKVIGESLAEVRRAIAVVDYMAGEAIRVAGETVPSTDLPDNFSYSLRQPLGVCALITPWNFPVAIPVWKLAPAIAVGNTVVIKPAPETPHSTELTVRALADSGLPPGVLNLVHGDAAAGQALIDHPAVQALSFTGSAAVGLVVYQRAARRGIRVQCELGGKNPMVVLADADLDHAVGELVFAGYGSTGQRCSATGRVLVDERVADDFVGRLAKRAGALALGSGLEAKTQMGPSGNPTQYEKVLGYIQRGRSEGAALVCGGARAGDGALAGGLFIQPTIFDHVKPAATIAREEIFGPVLPIIRVRDLDEAIEVANSVSYGLSSAIFTNDLRAAMRFVERVETGLCRVNTSTAAGEYNLPFGGMKGSAIGAVKEQGREAVLFFTESKTVGVYYGAPRAK